MARREVLELDHRARAAALRRGHELLHQLVVGGAAQARLFATLCNGHTERLLAATDRGVGNTWSEPVRA